MSTEKATEVKRQTVQGLIMFLVLTILSGASLVLRSNVGEDSTFGLSLIPISIGFFLMGVILLLASLLMYSAICPNCGRKITFSKIQIKKKCFSCKKDFSFSNNKIIMLIENNKSVEWKCTFCGTMNPSLYKICNQCKKPRP
jgi:hypothetical protein